MDSYFEAMKWWALPLGSIGTPLLMFLYYCLGFLIVLGILYYIIHRL